MVGAVLGALHGTSWLPASWWAALENDTARGKDFAVHLGRQLAALDLHSVLKDDAPCPPVEPPS